MNKLKISLFCLGWFSQLAFADQQTFLQESPRSLGRGGARVAVPDSDEASRINPATMGENPVKFQLRFLELDVLIGKNTMDTISDITSALSDSDGISTLKKFSDKFGKKQYARGQLSLLGLRVGSFETTPFASSSMSLEFNTDEIPSAEWESDTVAGQNVSYAHRINPTLTLGMTLRYFTRIYIAGSMATDQFMDISNNSTTFEDISPVRQGSGIGGDMGLIWQPIANHRVGVMIQNIGDSGYLTKSAKNPPHLLQRTSIGYHYRKPLWGMNWDYLADIQGIENREGLNWVRLFHTGIEVGKSLFSRDSDFGVTFGLSEGYVTSGLYFDFFIARIDIVNYTAETGQSVGQNKDQRWGYTLRSSMTF